MSQQPNIVMIINYWIKHEEHSNSNAGHCPYTRTHNYMNAEQFQWQFYKICIHVHKSDVAFFIKSKHFFTVYISNHPASRWVKICIYLVLLTIWRWNRTYIYHMPDGFYVFDRCVQSNKCCEFLYTSTIHHFQCCFYY